MIKFLLFLFFILPFLAVGFVLAWIWQAFKAGWVFGGIVAGIFQFDFADRIHRRSSKKT